jgi:hypothetical protein
MKKIILKWLGLAMGGHGDVVRTVIDNEEQNKTPNFRIGLIKSVNSWNVLEIGTYAVTNRGHGDWTYEFYVVEPDQKLSEALSVVMTMKGLEK